ncbi:MAG: porin [Pseudomonadota bacterium]
MKKILLASSALALTASVAAAEVTVGGDAYYGIAYTDVDGVYQKGTNGEDTDYSFVYDLDIDFTASGESDGGLIFGANIDADDTPGAQGTVGFNGTVFVTGEFGQLAMGDTGGAAEEVNGDLPGNVSLTGNGDFNENIYLLSAGDPSCEEDNPNCNGGQGPLALYTYDIAGFTGAVGLNDEEGYSLGAAYDGGLWNVALGYESVLGGSTITIFDTDLPIGNDGDLTIATDPDGNRIDHIIGSVGVGVAGVAVTGTYGYLEYREVGAPTREHTEQWGIGAEYTFDAVTLGIFYRALDPSTLDNTYFVGGGVSYDLGGGLAIVAGVTYADITVPSNDDPSVIVSDDGTFFDFGLDFAF